MKIIGNAVIAQGGGPTAVINQSLVGAVLEMQYHSEITGIYGALHGVRGIINEDFIDLSFETSRNLEAVANTPCSALFSTRDKPDAKYCKQIFRVFKKYNIRYFFYIGGNDSSDTVLIINKYAEKENYDFRAFHIPKTIDNDLELNDHTPGYGSAAKFVAEAFMGANLETKALPSIYIGVVMGRHAGFLTAAAALGRALSDDGPHLLYMPERAFNIDKFLKDVKTVYGRLGRCLIAVSEGIIDKEGTQIAAKLKENITYDAHGNIELAGGELGKMLAKKIKETIRASRVRADTFGYLQRSFAGTVSITDQIEAREVGAKAVIFSVSGYYKSGSVIIKRVGNYNVIYELTDLANIAAKTRNMPDSYITKEGNQVTEEFIKYGLPLLGPTFKKAANLRAKKIDKIK